MYTPIHYGPITIKWLRYVNCYWLSNLAKGVADMFYVTLDHCPIGFTLQPNKKACDCDAVLENSVLSIDVNNGTIQGPAKIWIHAALYISGRTIQAAQVLARPLLGRI